MATVVTRQPGDTDDKLISKFRRAVQQSNLLDQIKDRLHYLKPAARRNKEKQSKRKRKPNMPVGY